MSLPDVLSKTAQATLLLTSYFSKASSDDVKPLTNGEWGRFALWLKERSIAPADLLVTDPKSLINGWNDDRVSAERIIQLLSRGHSLALAVEKWQRAGLWVVTRSDPEYPGRLKQRLKTDSPPVLFGCGNKDLLNVGGLAVVGSRNAGEYDLRFTELVGAKAAAEGVAIVSGGARGVDEAAMLGAIGHGGRVIGIMADSLLKAATSAKWRNGLMCGQLVLISPFYPEAGFSAGNAMARNKYIYCLADSSLVIHSGLKGGTLNGAEENLKKGWVPLWVKPTSDKDAANANLVAKGGYWCDSDINALSISTLCTHLQLLQQPMQVEEHQTDLFSLPFRDEPSYKSTKSELLTDSPHVSTTTSFNEYSANIAQEATELVSESIVSSVDFYQVFVAEVCRLAKNPVTQEALLAATKLNKSQLNEWLERATAEGVVLKLNRPTRYQANTQN